jgi:hypothetical protein
MDACQLENRSSRSTSYDAGPRGSRLEEHTAGTGFAYHRVSDGGASQGHPAEGLFGFLDPFLNGKPSFLRLSITKSDGPGTVTDHHERGKAETPAPFHNFGDSVDLYGSVLVLLLFSHLLELQSSFSCRVC